MDVELGLARAAARSDKDRFEREQAQFFQRVRAAYLHRSEAQSKRFLVVNAADAADEIGEEIYLAVCEKFKW